MSNYYQMSIRDREKNNDAVPYFTRVERLSRVGLTAEKPRFPTEDWRLKLRQMLRIKTDATD